MNLIGKIFVMLIFVMSLVFMGCAIAVWSVDRAYYEAVEKYKAQETDLRGQLGNLEQEKANLTDELARERVANQMTLAALQSEKAQLENELNGIRMEQDQLREDARTAIAEMDVMQQNLSAWRDEVQQLRDQLRTAQVDRSQQFDRVVNLTDEYQQAQGELDRLTSRQRELTAQVTRMRDVLQDQGLSEYLDRPAKVDGVVESVSGNRLVGITIGRDDGIQVNDTLEVYRGSTYLGRIRVLTARPDEAVGEIIKSMQRGVILEGDNVTTQIKVGR